MEDNYSDAKQFKAEANKGRQITKEVVQEEIEIKEEEIQNQIEEGIKTVLEESGIEEEEVDSKMLEIVARSKANTLLRKADDIKDLEEFKSELSFSPRVSGEAFERVAENRGEE